MIEIQLNKDAELTFKLDIEGSDQTPQSKFSLQLAEGELVLPGIIEKDKTTIRIPALTKFRESLGKTAKASLNIYIGDSYFTPWEDTITISEPISVKAEAVDVSQKADKRLAEKETTQASAAVSVRIIENEVPTAPAKKPAKPPAKKRKQQASNPAVQEFLKGLQR